MVPAALMALTKCHIERRISMSTPAVGSSRISSLGSFIIARAIIRRRFMPPDISRAWWNALSHSRSSFRYFSARSAASLRGMP